MMEQLDGHVITVTLIAKPAIVVNPTAVILAIQLICIMMKNAETHVMMDTMEMIPQWDVNHAWLLVGHVSTATNAEIVLLKKMDYIGMKINV